MPIPLRRLAPFAPMLALVLVLAACGRPLPEPVYPEITFRASEPWRLDVASIEVVEAYRSPLAAPNVEHEAPITPAQAMRRWAEDRLKAVGSAGVARLTIRDAAIVESNLPVNQDLEGSFTTEQAVRFDARLAVELEVFDGRGMPQATVRGKVDRVRSLPENATVRERDEVLYQITEDLVTNMDKIMSDNIPKYLDAYLR